jgi:PKD repeat protein
MKTKIITLTILVVNILTLLAIFSCKKTENTTPPPVVNKKPKADFSFTSKNQGSLPDTVNFTSTSTDATSFSWTFDDGNTSTIANPQNIYSLVKTYNVKLIVTNQYGSDSIIKPVNILLNKPIANFSFTLTNQEILPVTFTPANATIGSNVTYVWSFGNNTTSTLQNPTTNYTGGGIYNIKLVATNAGGSDSIMKQINISPYPLAYRNFNGVSMNLFAWEGNKVMILSRNSNLNRVTMFKWLKAMDTTYGYYKNSTGREPGFNPPTYINNRSTIADVTSTCGAGCGYLGATGIELQNTYFDVMYNSINNNNQYDQAVFYEFGRNFWFYGNHLAYKTNDPITTGYAVFMRFMAIEAAGVNGAPFGPWSFPTFRKNVENLIDSYLANASLNWANTLGLGQGVPGSGLGATDLFASFCFRLRRDYGGETFIQNIWKKSGQRPTAITTQDAVDNFFIASCQSANKNLTTLFQTWRWPLSAKAITEAAQYP